MSDEGMTVGNAMGIALGASERVRLSITAWAIKRFQEGLAAGRSLDTIITEDLAFGHLQGVDPRRLLVEAGVEDVVKGLK